MSTTSKKLSVFKKHAGDTSSMRRALNAPAKLAEDVGTRIAPKKRATPPPPMKVRPGRGKIIEPHHIEAVKKHLKKGMANAITMTTLAKRLRCSKNTAMRRFSAFLVRSKGIEKVKCVPIREGSRGPTAQAYYL